MLSTPLSPNQGLDSVDLVHYPCRTSMDGPIVENNLMSRRLAEPHPSFRRTLGLVLKYLCFVFSM
jgi:hypothetical protein